MIQKNRVPWTRDRVATAMIGAAALLLPLVVAVATYWR